MKNKLKKFLRKTVGTFKSVLVFLLRLILRFLSAAKKNIPIIFKKIIWAVKNPKLVLTAFLLGFRDFRKFSKRLPKILREYFFLLFVSAEENVKRFHRIGIRNVPEVAEVKAFQKDLRRKSFKTFVTTCAAILLIITVPVIFKNRFAHSKSYAWVQAVTPGGGGWLNISSLTDGTAYANMSYLINWPKYWAIISGTGTGNGALSATAAGGVTLANIASQSVGETGATASKYTQQQGDYTISSSAGLGASGNGAYTSANGSTPGYVSLKKPNGAACTATTQCAFSGVCSTNCLGYQTTPCSAATDCYNDSCVSGACNDGLVDGYHFNETSGTTAADITGAKNLTATFLLTNLFTNPGFETGNYTGWTPVNGTFIANMPNVHSGTYGLGLNNNSTSLSQTISVPTTGLATISFWMNTSASYSTAWYLNEINITGSQCFGAGAGIWKQCTVTATLNAGSNTLMLSEIVGGLIYTDDFSVTMNPPTTLADTTTSKYGGASVKFGTGQYLAAASAITLGSANSWTISAWVKTPNNGGVLVADNGSYYIFIDGLGQINVVGLGSFGSAFVPANTFAHVAIVHVASGLTYGYINGSSAGTPLSPGTLIANVSYVGNISSGTSPLGNIDDLLIFNRALSATDVSNLYSRGEYTR